MSQTVNLKGSGDIRIIGPQASGKTTYMAALAYWPNANPSNSPIQNIEAADLSNTQNLIEMAENILLDSKPLPPNRRDKPLLYNVTIDLKPKFLLNPIATMTQKDVRMSISATDYAGELFQLLRNNSSDPDVQSYLDDCQEAAGLMIMIDATSSKTMDKVYSKSLQQLKTELDMRFEQRGGNKSKYRVALVFSKAEQPKILGYHQKNEISTFIKEKFPDTQRVLQAWRKNWNCKMAVFFCSAFGTIPGTSKANTKQDSRDEFGTPVLARPEFWQPFGLVAPLYWLYTGNGNIDLRKI